MIVLVANSGSSSLKFAVYEMGHSELLRLKGELSRVGRSEGVFRATGPDQSVLIEQRLPWNAAATAPIVCEWLQGRPEVHGLAGIGFRIVQGGTRYVEPQRVTPALLEALTELTPLAPEHLPTEIAAMQSFTRIFSDVPQVACFDTAFHRHMPPVAQTYALPPDPQVIRYGFHGLSYEFIVHALQRLGDRAATDGRVIIAHLGNGCSMAAVRNGIGIETTMGFTPAGGLTMSTRCGDIDPGVLVYLIRERGLDADTLNELVNHRAGLLGVSGLSPDMRELLAHESEHAGAALATNLFCYQARKFIGALAAALGGVDTLVFTGGMGIHSAEVRRRICDGLDFLRIRLDQARNAAHDTVISQDGGVVVRVLPTDEELTIARHTERLLASRA